MVPPKSNADSCDVVSKAFWIRQSDEMHSHHNLGTIICVCRKVVSRANERSVVQVVCLGGQFRLPISTCKTRPRYLWAAGS